MNQIIIPWVDGNTNYDGSYSDEIAIKEPQARISFIRYSPETFRALTTQQYPLIITALRMAPGLTPLDEEYLAREISNYNDVGFNLIARLRRRGSANQKTPIIVADIVTEGIIGKKDLELAIKLGANDFLDKLELYPEDFARRVLRHLH